MKNNLIVILLIFISSLTAFGQNSKSDTFEIKGIVTNGNNKKIYLLHTAGDKTVSDSLTVINNEFVYKGNISNSTEFKLMNEAGVKNFPTTNVGYVYLEPTAKETILFDYEDFRTLKANNTILQKERGELTELRKNNFDRLDSIRKINEFYRNKIATTTKVSEKKGLQTRINELNEFKKQIVAKQTELDLQFVRQHPSYFITADIIEQLFKNTDIDEETATELLNKLNTEVRFSQKGFGLSMTLYEYQNNKIGSLAPDFKVKDIKNKSLVLSSFREKQYILLDFWASYCRPCRAELPTLKTLYEKYHDKGLEIVSASTDKNSDAWHNAIIKEVIGKWKHFSIIENKSSIKNDYAVAGIPVKVLIDKEGKIIGRWNGFSEFNINELSEKLKQIFDN